MLGILATKKSRKSQNGAPVSPSPKPEKSSVNECAFAFDKTLARRSFSCLVLIVNKEKIIVALDVETAQKARAIVAELGGAVGAFKVGLQLFTAEGGGFVRELVRQNVKIFLDVKFHDIPNTVAGAAIEAARLGVWMLNVHALGGSEMMRRAAGDTREFCEKENLPAPKIIGVTILTSSNEETLREVGIGGETSGQVSRLAKLAYHSGLDGVVASPREVQTIRRNVKDKNFLIVTPGIRPQYENLKNSDDQKRTATPREAVQSGSDYLVIGRPILKSENLLESVKNILAGIEGAA